jgi:hypothetical protein
MVIFKIVVPFTLHPLGIFMHVFEMPDSFKANEFFLSSHGANLMEMGGM